MVAAKSARVAVKQVRFNPQFITGQIIVSFGDRRLYFVTRTGEAISYPIAIPRDEDRWEGETVVSNKRINPSWTPTPTMIAENPRLPRWGPGGHPMNPLGVRALYLGSSAYRIHGTDAPWTIGTAVSKGCIRMYNQDVLDLYPRVPIGAKVSVTWQRFGSGSGFASARSSTGPRLRPIERSDLPRPFLGHRPETAKLALTFTRTRSLADFLKGLPPPAAGVL